MQCCATWLKALIDVRSVERRAWRCYCAPTVRTSIERPCVNRMLYAGVGGGGGGI